MSEVFSSITLEVMIDGVWIDLWPDVLHSLGVKGTRGIQSNGIEDRVGDAGMLTFSLRNDASNSAGLIGYYSPGHANCLDGWTTSLPIRLGFSYDTWTRYKWAGRITPDGIKVSSGTNALRRVDITCEDFMGLASRHKMNLMTAKTDKHLNEALQLVIENMPLQPAAVQFDTGIHDADTAPDSLIFPLLFDISSAETTALGEFQRIATSASPVSGSPGLGYVVTRGDGLNGETLFATYRGFDVRKEYMPTPTALASRVIRQDNTDFILLESGDFLLREGGTTESLSPPTGNEIPNFVDADIGPESQFSYGAHIANYVTVVSYPRKIDDDATTALWTLENAIEIGTNDQITIRGAYNDPSGGAKINGIEFVDPPEANTDYKANTLEDGTGTNMTASLGVLASFGAAEVELTLSNSSGANNLFVGGGTIGSNVFLQVRGKGVYSYDTARQISTDATSMKTHGVKPLTVDSKYIDFSKVFAGIGGSYGDSIISIWKDPLTSIDRLELFANRDVKNMVNFLFLEPRDSAYITESMNAINNVQYFIQGIEFEIIDGQNVFWRAVFKNS